MNEITRLIILIALSTWLVAPWAASEAPWFAALKHRDWEAVEQLVRQGADVNRPSEKGASALMRAAAGGQEIAGLLLDHGADVNAISVTGWTPLMLAAVKGHEKIIATLLQRGADPNSADTQEEVPRLH